MGEIKTINLYMQNECDNCIHQKVCKKREKVEKNFQKLSDFCKSGKIDKDLIVTMKCSDFWMRFQPQPFSNPYNPYWGGCNV